MSYQIPKSVSMLATVILPSIAAWVFVANSAPAQSNTSTGKNPRPPSSARTFENTATENTRVNGPRTTDPLYNGFGFILIRGNGQVHSGMIRPEGERFRIEKDPTTAIYIHRDRILFIAPKLVDLYWYQRGLVVQLETGDHMHFATWCIKNNLLDLAYPHYQQLQKRIPDSPQLSSIQRKYKAALVSDPETRRLFGLPPISRPNVHPISQQPITRNQPQPARLPGSYPTSTAAKTISNDEQDNNHETGNFSNDTAESHRLASNANAFFVQPASGSNHGHVQTAISIDRTGESNPTVPRLTEELILELQRDLIPVLQSRCGQAACHGALATNTLIIPRNGYENFKNRRRLIESIVKHVDIKTPAESELLRYATRPHAQNSDTQDRNTEANTLTAHSAPIDATLASDKKLIDRLTLWISKLDPQYDSKSVRPAIWQTQIPPEIAAAHQQQFDMAIHNSGTKSTNANNFPIQSHNDKNDSEASDFSLDQTTIETLEREIARLEQIEKSRRPVETIQKPKNRHDAAIFNQQR